MKPITEYLQSQLCDDCPLTEQFMTSTVVAAAAAARRRCGGDASDGNQLMVLFADIKDWWYDRKARAIMSRLLDDEDIKAFFEQPLIKQKTGWRKLLLSKLEVNEIKYMSRLTKAKIKDALQEIH